MYVVRIQEFQCWTKVIPWSGIDMRLGVNGQDRGTVGRIEVGQCGLEKEKANVGEERDLVRDHDSLTA